VKIHSGRTVFWGGAAARWNTWGYPRLDCVQMIFFLLLVHQLIQQCKYTSFEVLLPPRCQLLDIGDEASEKTEICILRFAWSSSWLKKIDHGLSYLFESRRGLMLWHAWWCIQRFCLVMTAQCGFSLTHWSWRWRWYVPRKCWVLYALHGITI
jgi:hypothetical protein